MGGRWGGGSSERCLKWGGEGSFQKRLKTGGGQRRKLFVGGFEGVTTPAPPRKF